jgi:hypothetical protein
MNVPSRSVVLTIALLIGLIASAGLAQADDTAWKAAHDTDPHLPLTQKQLDTTAAKRAAEPQNGGMMPASLVPMGPCGSCTGGGSYPSSASLVANQTPQQTSYWGGGTSPSGYPVPDVMNRYQSRNYYVPQPVSSATSSAISTYENDLEMDISAIRAPLIGNVWEVPNGQHLNGHPGNLQIFHWFEIRGYYGSGGTTLYEDSVHGATSISWSGSVPAYSNQPSSQILTMLGGRGYVW